MTGVEDIFERDLLTKSPFGEQRRNQKLAAKNPFGAQMRGVQQLAFMC